MSAKAERLVNLTVALLATSRPLTFSELRTRMGEWDDGAHESMRRKFERDKDELRRLGVPIETVELDHLGGELGYRIDPDRYALPAGELTVAQVSVLAVAHQLVDGADQLGFTQVAATAPDPDPVAVQAPGGVRIAPAPTEAVEPLARALRDGRVVRFTHRKPGGEATPREVEPTGLLCRRGTWYLRGHDRTRDDERVFRLDRIVGEVEVTDEVVALGPQAVDDDVRDVFAPAEEVDVEVAVRDRDGWRTEGRRDRPMRAVTRTLAAAPDELLLAPAEARQLAVDGLRAVLAAHGDVQVSS